MKLTVSKQNSEELEFESLSIKASLFVYDEETEFFVVANDTDCTAEEIAAFVSNSTMDEVGLEKLDRAEREKAEADRFRAKVLCAIAEFSSTLIARRQLGEYLDLSEGKSVSRSMVNSALRELKRLGFIETCKVKKRGAESDKLALFRLSPSRQNEIAKIISGRICYAEGEKHGFERLNELLARKALENNLISQLVIDMFKQGFITEAYLPARYDQSAEKASISAMVSVAADDFADGNIYLFAPRKQPGSLEYLKAAVSELAAAHSDDETLPKLLLCCEDADGIYDAHDALSDLYNEIEIIFTDDVSFMNDFRSAFSVFDANGTELQLEIGASARKHRSGRAAGRPASRQRRPRGKQQQ